LIRGDEHGYSHALSGIFDGDCAGGLGRTLCPRQRQRSPISALLDPTVPLSRHIFQRPTFYYKTGVVFLAYLDGHQRHFRMLGRQKVHGRLCTSLNCSVSPIRQACLRPISSSPYAPGLAARRL
jgi:hypothetical protein